MRRTCSPPRNELGGRAVNVIDTDQIADGYSVERLGGFVLVWHHNAQVALLADGPDVRQHVQQIIARRRGLLSGAAHPKE